TGHEVDEDLVDGASRRRPQPERDAVVDRAGRQRRDDRLQASEDDDEAVERAAEEPARQHDQHAQRGLDRRADDQGRREAVRHHEHHADRQIEDGGEDRNRWGDGDEGKEGAFVGRGVDDIEAEARRVLRDEEGEHRDEERGGDERAPVRREPVAPVSSHAGTSAAVVATLWALATMLRSLISSRSNTRTMAPSYRMRTRSQQPMSSA